MNKENIEQNRIQNIGRIQNRILFGHKQEENLAICKNIDETRGHYAK